MSGGVSGRVRTAAQRRCEVEPVVRAVGSRRVCARGDGGRPMTTPGDAEMWRRRRWFGTDAIERMAR